MKRNANRLRLFVLAPIGALGLAVALPGAGRRTATPVGGNGPVASPVSGARWGPPDPRNWGELALTKEVAPTFRIGEQLEYRISWANLLTAATAELTVNERRSFYGREAWHFRATARTVDAARLLYTLDDQFDSYTDTKTLESLRYEMYLREQGEQQKAIVRMSAEGHPAQNDGPMVRVLRGTRDPLAVLYYLRTINWSRETDARSPIYDGRKMYDLRARAASLGQVSVPAGTYSAVPIELRVFERDRELTQVRIRVWLANNVDRTPALIEAEMPFGKLRAELARINAAQKR